MGGEVFDAHAKKEQVTFAVFPTINNEASLVELLNGMANNSRWRVRRRVKTSPTQMAS
jgi:hypothetical protein